MAFLDDVDSMLDEERQRAAARRDEQTRLDEANLAVATELGEMAREFASAMARLDARRSADGLWRVAERYYVDDEGNYFLEDIGSDSVMRPRREQRFDRQGMAVDLSDERDRMRKRMTQRLRAAAEERATRELQ
ncbi:MAG: hypothetical protein WBI91_09335 [Coriobacteriia bacterium]